LQEIKIQKEGEGQSGRKSTKKKEKEDGV